MAEAYLIEPVACTPAAGWEKGQVENQVGLVRERFFTPRLRVSSYEALNALLLDRCVAYAKAHKHPEIAAAEKIDRSYLCRVLRLTLLAPELVEAHHGWPAGGVDDPAGIDEGVSGGVGEAASLTGDLINLPAERRLHPHPLPIPDDLVEPEAEAECRCHGPEASIASEAGR